VRQTDLRLQALVRELDECRRALRDAVDEYERARRRRAARRRRGFAALALILVFAAGLATGDAPNFGASAARAANPCGEGSAAVKAASFAYHNGSVTATFTVAAGCSGTEVTLASYEKLGGPDQLFPQTLYRNETETLDAGVHSLTVALPDCFWQDDLATGPALPAIAPGSLYSSRLVISDKGGTTACPPVTTTTGTTTTGTTATATTVTTATTITTGTTTGTTPTTGTTTTATSTSISTTTTTTTPPPPPPPPPPTTTTPAPPPATDVSITKVPDRTSAVVGQRIVYVLDVVNNGAIPAVDVVVVDPLPPQESLVSVSDTACTGTTIISCSFGTLAPGDSRSVSIVTLARSPGTAENTATVTTTTPETTTSNNEAHASVPITAPFLPPPARPICATVNVHHSTLLAGRPAVVDVVARRAGKPARGVRVEVRGMGVDIVRRTTVEGTVRVTLTPRAAGVLRVAVQQPAKCGTPIQEFAVPGAFRPPRLTG
jgi:hypothetical protein